MVRVLTARYYWGSINTHRYTIWRHARKMRGRCFAVNYRSMHRRPQPVHSRRRNADVAAEAPQYPFPCAIQDCLAGYLYLIKPPPGAKHHPVSPKNIVIAGDSAGGGLVLALLQILRDTDGLDLPAGAVLISPVSAATESYDG
jgi:acetyl esterase/lipase